MSSAPTTLLTGATGYVGGRLLEALEAAGHPVRCLARRPDYLRGRAGPGTEIVRGDCLDPASLDRALSGVHTAYYLVHSMGDGGDFAEQDARAASNFGQAAARAGVRRIIYLGGIVPAEVELSAHLRSRQETGDQLRRAGVPVTEFRASIILGSGSLSFELIRALVERLPIMLCPRWVATLAQPIAIEDVISYLTESLRLPDDGRSRTFEIGGADCVSYGEIMLEYARQRRLKRYLLFVPVLTPRLSAMWLGLTTPVYARVGRKLIESIRNPTVVTDDTAAKVFEIRPMGLRESIERAILNEDRDFAVTRWSSAISSGGVPAHWGGVRFGTRLVDSRTADVKAQPREAFAPIRRIGGETGWYYANWLWRVRGWIDLLVGGVGLRRGRRDRDDLVVGDTVDFWRVEAFESDKRLRLYAEMKLPGRAWLEFEVEPTANGSRIRQTAEFDAWGVAGRLYWYGVYAVHARVFAGMLRGLARAACGEADLAAAVLAGRQPADLKAVPTSEARLEVAEGQEAETARHRAEAHIESLREPDG